MRFHRRHSSINNSNILNVKDQPLLFNGGATIEGLGSVRESLPRHLKKSGDIETGEVNSPNSSTFCCYSLSNCCRKQQKSLFKKVPQQTARLVDKEGNCLIRPINYPYFNVFK